MYTVSLGEHMTFPADYPPPDSAVLQQALGDVRLYITEADEEHIRSERLYSVTVKGHFTSAARSEMQKRSYGSVAVIHEW